MSARDICPDCGQMYSLHMPDKCKPAQLVALREWWLDEEKYNDADDELFGYALKSHPGQGPLLWQTQLIHVIEHSAYTALLAEAEALAGALEVLKVAVNDKVNDPGATAFCAKALSRWAAWRGKR